MRNTTISSSIASVVTRVIASVANAGAVRCVLDLTLMREHMGTWHEPCRPGYAFAGSYQCCQQPFNPGPSKPLGKRLLRQNDISAPAFYTALSRLKVRAVSRG